MLTPSLQQLKCISVDIATKCHLGMCIAIRVDKALSLMTTKPRLTAAAVTKALERNPHSRKSQQKFLHPKSEDVETVKGNKGCGGNTTTQHCYTIQQSMLDKHNLQKIRKGNLSLQIIIIDS